MLTYRAYAYASRGKNYFERVLECITDVILMQEMQNFSGEGPSPDLSPSGEGDTPSPHPAPLGASILTLPILKFCLRY